MKMDGKRSSHVETDERTERRVQMTEAPTTAPTTQDAERAGKPAVDWAAEGLEDPDDDSEYLVEKVDVRALTPYERRVQAAKDCFWNCESVLSRWFGVDDSKYSFEMALKEEEEEKQRQASVREERQMEELSRVADERAEAAV